MTGSAVDLLRTLGGSGGATKVRPDTAPPAPSADQLARSGTFAELLAAARSGDIASNVPITVLPTAGVELSPDQLQRLSVAADMAQAAGSTHALVQIDGMNLLMDVGARSITGSVKLVPGEVVTGIDSMIQVPAAPGVPTVEALTAPTSALRQGPLAAVPPAVARALARDDS
ncbi:MAG: hypothetical protein GIKADHBN_02811 [Phycisphaerales bacterium]|nr:hypothetical protein [Phycisphaerales bacterium]